MPGFSSVALREIPARTECRCKKGVTTVGENDPAPVNKALFEVAVRRPHTRA